MDRNLIADLVDRFTELAAGATTIGLLAVADRSGLLQLLAAEGPATPGGLAAGGLQERYVVEILSGLAAAGLVEYDPVTSRFSMSAEQAAMLADDASPYSMAGWFDMVPELFTHVDEVAAATRDGGGVPFDRFGDRMVRGIDRGNGPSMTVLLTRRWLPTMPDVVERLQAGAAIADVGCGSGAAAVAMARAYPASTVSGFDVSAASLDRARESAGGLANLVFEQRSAADIPVDTGFVLVTTFDVVHDLVDPLGALRRIREALTDGGVYLMMEPRANPRLEDNFTPRGALLYGISTLHCMTQSLAHGGAGLGSAWGPERAEALVREAGFGSFRELPIDNPFSAFYRVEA